MRVGWVKRWTAGESDRLSCTQGLTSKTKRGLLLSRSGLDRRWKSAAVAVVLYRSNAQSRVIEEALIRVGMPYRIYGGQRFYERLEIRNALAYLRLMTGRGDDPAFERVINTPTRGIGSKTIDDLRSLARERVVSMWQAIELVFSESLLTPRARTALAGFKALVDDWIAKP